MPWEPCTVEVPSARTVQVSPELSETVQVSTPEKLLDTPATRATRTEPGGGLKEAVVADCPVFTASVTPAGEEPSIDGVDPLAALIS